MTVSRSSFVRVVEPDADGGDKLDWLKDTTGKPPEDIAADAKRLQQFERGDVGFVGVRAKVTLTIPMGQSSVVHDVESPGLWAIESDSGEDYFNEVFGEESNTLADMLTALGVTVTD